jgi:WD40 repeat protein
MLWDIADPEHPKLLARLTGRTTIISGFVGAVAFAPDGTTLATGGFEGRVVLWDVTNRGSPAMLAALTDTGPMAALAFSRDGHTLAGGSFDKTAILWDVTDHSYPFRLATLTGHAGPVDTVAFNSDGQTLGTGSSDGTATLWDTSRRTRIALDPVDSACAITDGGLTADEWRRYAPALPYRPTCVP